MTRTPKRRGHATGGLSKREPKSEAWIDHLPSSTDDETFWLDKKMAIHPKMDIDDDITTGPQPQPNWMDLSRGGKVRKTPGRH